MGLPHVRIWGRALGTAPKNKKGLEPTACAEDSSP